MELTKIEKELFLQLINEHLAEVRKNEKLQNEPPVLLGAEMRYEDFLVGLVKKLKH